MQSDLTVELLGEPSNKFYFIVSHVAISISDLPIFSIGWGEEFEEVDHLEQNRHKEIEKEVDSWIIEKPHMNREV